MIAAGFLAICEGRWSPALPAPSGAVSAMARDSGLVLPSDYLEFLTLSNGGDGFLSIQPSYFRLWPAEQVVSSNQDYQMPEFLPGFFAFGDAGGHEFFAFDARGSQPWPVVSIPFVPMDAAEALAVAGSFTELLRYLSPPKDPNAATSAAASPAS